MNEVRTIRVQPTGGWAPLALGEVWRYRELAFFLAWRDISVRYKQTALGAAWAVLQPFLTMVVFSLLFGRLVKIPSDGVPYPLFAYCALVPWQYFAGVLAGSAESLVVNQNLITKVYFPRLLIPLSQTLSLLLDFLLAFAVLLGMMCYYGVMPGVQILVLPLLLLWVLVTALGMGLWISALNVQYRDFKYVVPFMVQLWLFVSPVAYPASMIPAKWRMLYSLNPMTGVIEGFRWALLKNGTVDGGGMLISVGMALVLLMTGAYYFRRMERTFADRI